MVQFVGFLHENWPIYGEGGVELRLIHERELFHGGKCGGIAGRAGNEGEYQDFSL